MRSITATFATLAFFAVPVAAQTEAQTGVEVSIGPLYQTADEIAFDGGATLRSDSGIGVVASVGYRFNSRFDVIAGFEAATFDYELTLQSSSSPTLEQQFRGEYEVFTPFLKVHYNFLDQPLTPFVSGGIGWAFINTDIATGDVYLDCWWDPWYGYVCDAYAETKGTDAFAYHIGVGGRWMFNDTYGLRVEYQKQWMELDRARGTPNFDQVRATFVVKY
jgi:opacity protein-like surface antigen